MRFILIVLAVIVYSSILFSQDKISYNHTHNFADIKKKKLVNRTELWLSQQTNLNNVQHVENIGFKAEGYVTYANPIEYQGSETLSRVYAKQTNGKIVYKVDVLVKNNKVELNIT